MNRKQTLRTLVLTNRRLLSEEAWTRLGRRVRDNFLQLLPSLPHIRTIHSFLPIKSNREADTTLLFPTLARKNITILVSKTDFKSHSMSHFIMDDSLELAPGPFRIPTPVSGTPGRLSDADLILIPSLATDKQGGRIGYGGGYYDQLLKSTGNEVLKIGLNLAPCFDGFRFMEKHDQKLDYCITPYEIIDCKHV